MVIYPSGFLCLGAFIISFSGQGTRRLELCSIPPCYLDRQKRDSELIEPAGIISTSSIFFVNQQTHLVSFYAFFSQKILVKKYPTTTVLPQLLCLAHQSYHPHVNTGKL